METIQVRALAASKAKGKLEPFEFSLGSLPGDQVDIKVQYCGICHSDLAMLDNEFGWTQYPFVPGHEAVGVITAKGDHVPKLEVGQTVGLGWFSGSCMACSSCLAGDHNHCTSVEQNDRRTTWCVCNPCSLQLGMGDANPAEYRSSFRWASVLRRNNCIQSDHPA